MLDSLATYLIPAVVILIVMLTVGLIFARLYKRTTKEMSFVRTGFGGEKIVMNGGAMIMPVLHDFVMVNMQTLKLVVVQKENESFLTKDRLRADIKAEFYVRVQQNKESISKAAQTLGTKTLNPDSLKSLIESKFIDALRSVASKMTMSDLHEKRNEFVQEVQSTVYEDLLKNGLELESVSLTSFDQTHKSFFNEDNAFDAEGLAVLTKITEDKKRERNKIEQDTLVEIKEKNLEAAKATLKLEEEEEIAKSDQEALIAKNDSERKKEAEEARISSEKSIEEADINKELALDQARIKKDKDLEISRQNKSIEISEKSKEESSAKSEANKAKAEEEKSKEEITTARELEIANRDKELALIDAQKEAEEKSIGIKVEAETKKAAAEDNAESIKIEANANAEAIKIAAEANEKQYSVEAEGKEKLNKAENVLSQELIDLRFKEALVANLPSIIESMTKPMDNIDSIKIVDMGGLNGQGNGTSEANGSGTSSNLSNQIVDSALKYKVNAPLLDTLVKDLDLDLNSLAGPLSGLNKAIIPTPEVESNTVTEEVSEVTEEIVNEEVESTEK